MFLSRKDQRKLDEAEAALKQYFYLDMKAYLEQKYGKKSESVIEDDRELEESEC